jgi:large subunit ribosomal protein L21
MQAVIRAGGKQHKVTKGDVIDIELHKGGDTVEFTPLLIIDDKGKLRSGKSELAKARVVAKVLGETRGRKIDVFKFRNKSGYRRHTGHRQRYSSIEISDIKLTSGRSRSDKTEKEKGDGS